MFAYPEQRFVRFRLTSNDGGHRTATFTKPPPGFLPTPENHPLLAWLVQSDPARGKLVCERVAELARRSEEFFTWLERDSANSRLFLEDPQAAIRQALPDLAADFFDGWGTL
jgi:hypothetical protein